MNTNLNHGSARIYQFPVGGRAGLGRLGYPAAKGAETASRASEYDCGDSWYHQAAIDEAKRGQ